LTGVSYSLRGRLFVLLLLVFVPAVAMILFTHHQERRFLTGELERQVGRLLRLTIASEQAVVAGSRAALIALANARYVARRDHRECEAHAATMVREQPVYLNLGYVDAGGRLACSAIPAPASTNFSDRRWFRDARDSNGFTVGDYGVSRFTGDRAITYGYPVIGAGGVFEGVAFAVTNLSWLEEMVRSAELPPGSLALVVDADGRLLASHPRSFVGSAERLPAGAVREALAAHPAETVLTAADFDGKARIFGLAPLGVGERSLYLVIGLPVAATVGLLDDMLRANLLLVVLLALLSFAVAWYGTESLVIRRVRRLAGIADRVAAGDLSARAGEKQGIRELDQVGDALDRMVIELERRDRARSEAMDTLRDSEARYRDLVELSPDAIFIVIAGRVRFANTAAVSLLKAQSLRQVLGVETRDVVDPAFLPAVESRVARMLRGDTVPRMEQRYRCFDGSFVDVEVLSASYLYRGGARDPGGCARYHRAQAHGVGTAAQRSQPRGRAADCQAGQLGPRHRQRPPALVGADFRDLRAGPPDVRRQLRGVHRMCASG
jgi:PAS domain S-box-containing protein